MWAGSGGPLAPPLHFTAVMADREEQAEAFWENLPLPDQFPEPHAEGSDETSPGDVEGPSTNTEESLKAHPQLSSPNLLMMLKAAEGWKAPHARDREQGHAAAPDRVAEAQRADLVSSSTGDVNAHAVRMLMILSGTCRPLLMFDRHPCSSDFCL